MFPQLESTPLFTGFECAAHLRLKHRPHREVGVKRLRRIKEVCTKDGDGPQLGDVGPILILLLIVCLFGSGIYYLGERVHAPEQSRMIDVGPPD